MKPRTRSFMVKTNCKCNACAVKIVKDTKAFRAKDSNFVYGTICPTCRETYS